MPVPVTPDQLANLASLAGTVTLIEDAAQTLDDMVLEDQQVDAFEIMPTEWRIRIVARLAEMAELIREALRELDGRVFQLTAGEPPNAVP